MKNVTGSLRSNVYRAFSWTMVGQFGSLVARFVGSLILSRIFNPEIFGVLAVVAVVQIVAHLLTDIGIVQAVIQSKNGQNPTFLNTAWTIQIVRGALIWVFGVIAATALSIAVRWLDADSVYAIPYLPLILVVACFSSVIMGFQTTKSMIASRNLDIKRVTIIDLSAYFISLIFTIVVGELTRSVWSYVFGGILGSCLSVALSHIWLRGHVDRFAWNKDALKELSEFGRWVFISSALSGAAANCDRMFLAAVVNAANLGFYSLANNLLSIVDSICSRLFAAIALPALSAIVRSQPERLPKLYHKIRWLTDASMIGLAGFVFATGQAAVDFLYDPRYWQAGWMLQWLSFGLLFSRYSLAQNAYVALGITKYLSILNVVKLVSLAVLLPVLFFSFGLPGAIVAIAIHMLPVGLTTIYLNSKVRLNNFRLEIVVLAFWPIGWGVGVLFLKLGTILKAIAVGG
jgi:O-antigen/teichoic acid export membrane protein